MKTTFIVFMIIAMVFLAQTSHSTNIEMCVKHCIPNQCMKVAKKPDLALCEEVCKKFCAKQLGDHEEYIVPPRKDGGGFFTGIICDYMAPDASEACQISPLLDVVQNCNGYLFSRLFCS
ncbi:hypothetical protein HID58_065584 [Brassica napus]|uniref:Plant thionin family protein n=1 Tax=Brassica napus TaxID=3708 RepID=A0ABQ7ZD84_BRANA|nr:hypothetical protein HID58_065584 [Brassica napus]